VPRFVFSLLIAFVFLLPTVQPRAQSAMDPEAERVVRAMSAYLGGLQTFTADYDVDTDHVMLDGEKLQFSAWGRISMARPDRVHVERHGGLADIELTYDGKTVTIFGRRENVYAQMDAAGSVGDAVDALRAATGFDLPGGDLLYPDVADILLADMDSGAYWGTTVVEGVNCHYLAFRGRDVDLQLWVRAGERPLPMKLVLTSKWFAGAPQYAVRMRNWQENPAIDPGRFAFKPAAGARRLDGIGPELVGDLMQGMVR